MQIFHPPQAVNGMSPENVFYVADSANQTIAEGFIIPTYHPHLFPERPVNLYMSIRGHDAGKDMLLGALLARVRQLHEQTANMPAEQAAQMKNYMKKAISSIPAKEKRLLLVQWMVSDILSVRSVKSQCRQM